MILNIRAVVDLDYDDIYPGYKQDLLNGIYEDLPSGDIKYQPYDDQVIEDWYTFASQVEYMIDCLCDTVNISLSKSPNSLTEYIDFYAPDEQGNRQHQIIDMRLSDHDATRNASKIHVKHVKNVNPKYKLISVMVNNKKFKDYYDALDYVKKIIMSEMFHQ